MNIIEENIVDIHESPKVDLQKLKLADDIITTITPLLDETQYQLKVKNEELQKKLTLIEGNIFELKEQVDEKIKQYEKEKAIWKAISIIDKAIQNGSIYSGTLSSEVMTFLSDLDNADIKYIEEVLIPKLTEAMRNVRI